MEFPKSGISELAKENSGSWVPSFEGGLPTASFERRKGPRPKLLLRFPDVGLGVVGFAAHLV